MESKLNLNRNLVDKARESARRIAEDTQNFIDLHTTVTVERAVCRLLGIDGINALEVPLPNVVVDHLFDKGLLPGGAAYYIGNAMAETGMNPQQIAESIDRGELDLSAVAPHSIEEIRAAVMPVAEATAERIRTNVAKRNDYLNSFGDKTDPYLYVIVATGNIYEDIEKFAFFSKAAISALPSLDCRKTGCGHYRRYPHHRAESARLCSLRRNHRGFRRNLRNSGKLPPYACCA